MNKLCCELNAEFICLECGMRVCSDCYATELELRPEENKDRNPIMWHEEYSRCPKGANTWLNREDGVASTVIFAKVEKHEQPVL